MPEHYCESVIAILRETGKDAGQHRTNSVFSLLSPEGRILSALLQNGELIMKDIPHITGISFRSCFDCIRKLSDNGIIEKGQHSGDKRAVSLKLNLKRLCESLCGHAI